MGAAGAELEIWYTTVSGILIHRSEGDVLIDSGISAKVDAQMGELAPEKQAVARQILASYTLRRSAPEALAAAGEPLDRVTLIIPTHAHYDHLAGAEDLPRARILMPPDEIAFLDKEERTPDIIAASNIAAVRPRIQPYSFTDKPYLGFAGSFDVFEDDSIVLVPLPGHTPGSIGAFFNVDARRVFAIGDVTWIMEAVERGLPRPPALRAFADDDPDTAEQRVQPSKGRSRLLERTLLTRLKHFHCIIERGYGELVLALEVPIDSALLKTRRRKNIIKRCAHEPALVKDRGGRSHDVSLRALSLSRHAALFCD